MGGYKATAVCCVGGPKSREKGKKTAEAILKRCQNIFKMLKIPDFTRTHVQVLGGEDTYGLHARYGYEEYKLFYNTLQILTLM